MAPTLLLQVGLAPRMTELFLYKSVLVAQRGLLEPEELQNLQKEPELPSDLTDEEHAQLLAYEAFDYLPDDPDDARAVAGEALELDEACVDAMLCLWSLERRESDEALTLARRAHAVAEAKIERLPHWRRGIDDLWTFQPGCRGFVRAHAALAFTLWARGDRYEACGMAERVIALNPTDNTGMRWHLVNWYLIEDATGQAYRLLRAYPDEQIGASRWASALVEFLRSGPGKKARRAFLEAAEHNPGLMMMLTTKTPLSDANDEVDSFEPGDVTEALVWAGLIREAWAAHPEAMSWARTISETPEFADLQVVAMSAILHLLAENGDRSVDEILLDVMSAHDPDLL
ncbi:MAG: hypothetical protein ACOX9R_14755 [Armatimonadota bacterium]|jgi:tetratricopeptide (TPR) repeat protein